MDWYYYIALAAIVSQLLFLLQTHNNYRYALRKYKKERSWYRPRTVLIVPCKGLDSAFHANITSFFNLDYEEYLLWFVVADKSDPAYGELCELKNRLEAGSKAKDVQVFVADQGDSCSQKIHNLLYCYRKIGDDVDVLAFADSDIRVHSNWLSHLVYPLRREKSGAASGYRWFIPKKNNLASLALSALNAKIAQLLGNTRFNQAWGGSMAVRVDIFRRLGLETIWQTTLSDDLSLSCAVKKAGMKVVFVPAAKTWWFGLCSSLYSVLGIWGAAALALYAAKTQNQSLRSASPLFAAVSVVFFLSQLARAILRQRMARKLLDEEHQAMKAACIADVLAFWLWSLLLLFLIVSSAFGRTICWRGIRYKLISPTQTIVAAKPTGASEERDA
ncbi:MAG: glycosyltransferase family 2 protein [Planctomycetota bacterium]|jgi:cellulose synthase/poly-beta-1,6-N-acetylglucosamine synthase-like glycosyltransferase